MEATVIPELPQIEPQVGAEVQLLQVDVQVVQFQVMVVQEQQQVFQQPQQLMLVVAVEQDPVQVE